MDSWRILNMRRMVRGAVGFEEIPLGSEQLIKRNFLEDTQKKMTGEDVEQERTQITFVETADPDCCKS